MGEGFSKTIRKPAQHFGVQEVHRIDDGFCSVAQLRISGVLASIVLYGACARSLTTNLGQQSKGLTLRLPFHSRRCVITCAAYTLSLHLFHIKVRHQAPRVQFPLLAAYIVSRIVVVATTQPVQRWRTTRH